MVAVVGDVIGAGLQLVHTVGHHHAKARRLDHGQVVESVAEGHDVLRPPTQTASQTQQGLALIGVALVDLHIVLQGRGGNDAGEPLGQLTEHPLTQRSVHGEELTLLHIVAQVGDEGLQLRHRRTQLTDHFAVEDVVGVVIDLLLQGGGHPCAVVHEAVVDHRQGIEKGHDLHRLLPGDLGTVQHLAGADILDLGTVDGNGIVDKGQVTDGLGHGVIEPARGGDDPDALGGGCGQRIVIALRQLLVAVEERAVQIEGDDADIVLHGESLP